MQGHSILEGNEGTLLVLRGSKKPGWSGFGHCNLREPLIMGIGNYADQVPKPYFELVEGEHPSLVFTLQNTYIFFSHLAASSEYFGN